MIKKTHYIAFWLILIVSCFALCVFSGCKSQTSSQSKTLKVGTIAGPETMLMQTAKEVAQKKYGVTLDIIEFTDYAMPNAALDEGSIDANIFQHLPYLQASMKAHNYHLAPIAKVFIYPMGVYSKKIKSLDQLPKNAIVAIPNDPSNEARALFLLQKAGLIKVASEPGFNVTAINVTQNPRELQFKELDAAQLSRALADVDIAIINTTYALPAGLLLNKDAIYSEDKNSPYANLIVVREKEKDDPKFKALINAMQSDEVHKAAEKLFGNQAVAAW